MGATNKSFGQNAEPENQKMPVQVFFQACATLQTSIAKNRCELKQAYQLLYHNYLRKGYIQPNSGNLLYHRVFGLSTSRTLVAADQQGQITGTLSVVGDNPMGLHIEKTYPREIAHLREQKHRLMETTCLAIDEGREVASLAPLLALTHYMFKYVEWLGYDDLLLTIHPRHFRFYQRFFSAAPLGSLRRHQVVAGHPSIACRIEIAEVRGKMPQALRQAYESQKIAESQFLRPQINLADHQYFCRLMGLSPELNYTEKSYKPPKAA